MNPIVHGELSWLLSQSLRGRRERALVTVAGLLPDLDGLTLLAGEEAYGKYHHVLTHGVFAALVTCAGAGLLAKAQRARTALLALLAFHLHLLCDLAGSGPGWPLEYLYPLSRAETFWAGQWNLASWQNSSIGLAATLACLACARPFGRTLVELFSLKADAQVVAAVRARLGPKPPAAP